MTKFKLFIGYFGNGASIANSAVMESGDYKNIGHISEAGNIKLYVNDNYIPAADMDKIQAVAARHKSQTIDRLNKVLTASKYHSFERGYSDLLEECLNYTPYNDFSGLLEELRGLDQEGKKAALIDYYIKHF